MTALLHITPGMLLAACAGLKPDEWLRLMWRAGAGVTAGALGLALVVGTEALRSLLGYGPVAQAHDVGPAGGAVDLRDEVGRIAWAVCQDVMEARREAAETRSQDATGVSLDKLLASFERRGHSAGIPAPAAGGLHSEITADRVPLQDSGEIAASSKSGTRQHGRAPPNRS